MTNSSARQAAVTFDSPRLSAYITVYGESLWRGDPPPIHATYFAGANGGPRTQHSAELARRAAQRGGDCAATHGSVRLYQRDMCVQNATVQRVQLAAVSWVWCVHFPFAVHARTPCVAKSLHQMKAAGLLTPFITRQQPGELPCEDPGYFALPTPVAGAGVWPFAGRKMDDQEKNHERW